MGVAGLGGSRKVVVRVLGMTEDGGGGGGGSGGCEVRGHEHERLS